MATNNLSEISKDPNVQFNDLLGDFAISSPRAKLAHLKSELVLSEAALSTATTAFQKKQIQESIAGIKADIKKIGEISNEQAAKSTNKSLFDAQAYIDYARNYQTSTRWVDFKKDFSDKSTNVFVVNNKDFNMNKPVMGDPIKSEGTGLSVAELIKWSEAYPALQLRYQDFVFSKNVGILPNNRLVILRRFKHGAPDNLFDYYRDAEGVEFAGRPLSTMVTWVKPDKDFFSLSFAEGWDSKTGDFFSFMKGKKAGDEDSAFRFDLYNLGDNSLFFALLSSLEGDDKSGNAIKGTDGFALGRDKVGNFLNEPGGNPNLIRKAGMRRIGGDNSLNSDIRFDIEFEFEMRYMQGVDPGVLMLDLISNCARMGTSVAQFRFDIEYLQSETIQRIINGDFEIEIQGLFSKMTDTVGSLTKDFVNMLGGIYDTVSKGVVEVFQNGDKAGEVLTQASQHIFSRYRENIKNALAAETGIASASWHITIGNPKNPIVSCGDLMMDGSVLTLGKELGYNDFPNTFTYAVTLKSARERGRNEIERIFNAGRGRFYVYAKPSDNPDYHLHKTVTKKS